MPGCPQPCPAGPLRPRPWTPRVLHTVSPVHPASLYQTSLLSGLAGCPLKLPLPQESWSPPSSRIFALSTSTTGLTAPSLLLCASRDLQVSPEPVECVLSQWASECEHDCVLSQRVTLICALAFQSTGKDFQGCPSPAITVISGNHPFFIRKLAGQTGCGLLQLCFLGPNCLPHVASSI